MADIHLDATTFQRPLEELAEVLAQKVKREAPKLLPAPPFVSLDLHVLIRQAIYTYNLLFYLNSDERREGDCYWRNTYTIVTLPLVRNMIDCLYNVTAILQDPGTNGVWFRLNGYRRLLEALDMDEKRYGGRPEWDDWIKNSRDQLEFSIRNDRLKKADVLTVKTWPTLGTYIRNNGKSATTTPHQDFLKTFVLGRWREYSAMAHGSFEGLMLVAPYFIKDSIPHELRPELDAKHPRVLAMHIGRAAGVLLCIVTELQAYFRFDDDGARIDQRIHQAWAALMPVYEVKELYQEHYARLMKDRRIEP